MVSATHCTYSCTLLHLHCITVIHTTGVYSHIDLPCWNLWMMYLQTHSHSVICESNLQPQSMSPQMPILLRTEHILLAVWSLWSWRQSCWLVAEQRYCLGHFGGTPCSTVSWSGCHSHDKDGSNTQKRTPQCCYRHNLDESVKQHNYNCQVWMRSLPCLQ